MCATGVLNSVTGHDLTRRHSETKDRWYSVKEMPVRTANTISHFDLIRTTAHDQRYLAHNQMELLR